MTVPNPSPLIFGTAQGQPYRTLQLNRLEVMVSISPGQARRPRPHGQCPACAGYEAEAALTQTQSHPSPGCGAACVGKALFKQYYRHYLTKGQEQ